MTSDYPEADGTDAAHPAWWRGNDAGVVSLCAEINAILDGKDSGRGVAREPWEGVRRRLLALVPVEVVASWPDGHGGRIVATRLPPEQLRPGEAKS